MDSPTDIMYVYEKSATVIYASATASNLQMVIAFEKYNAKYGF